MGSVVRGVRATAGEWAAWGEAAGDQALNSWVRLCLNAAAEAVLAERRRAADAAAERDRLKSLMRGL